MHKFLQTARDKALVIVDRERPFFTPGAMSMYTLALVAEAPVIIARYLLALLIVFAILVIEGNPHGSTEWALVALIPTAWSTLALFNPTGGAWWWQTRAGGREPSKREQLAYQDAVELLQSKHREPAAVAASLVRDRLPAARRRGLRGRADALTGLVGNGSSPGGPRARAGTPRQPRRPPDRRDQPADRVLHPVPRRRGSRTFTAPDRAAAPPAIHPTRSDGCVRSRTRAHTGPVRVPRFLFIAPCSRKAASGYGSPAPYGAATGATREYHADQYAASLGQAEELADFLEVHALIHDNPIPFLWLTEHTHPPTELRIDRLRTGTDEIGADTALPASA